MTDNGEVTEAPVKWPSVDDAKPGEEGGPTARKGFNYQDEIAVSFLIDMLETPTILKVHCETHDDILLVRLADDSTRVAEFVQVKGTEQDKLWSVADLCKRKGSAPGTSVCEKSIGRDQHDERARFRIVTLRPVTSELEILTFPCGTKGREPGCERFKELQADLDKRFPNLKSPKGNGLAYWLENSFWDQRDSESAVHNDCLLRLLQLSVHEHTPLLPEQAELILIDLRRFAKAAGDAKWDSDPSKKIILRSHLRTWWESRVKELIDGAIAVSGGKLAAKMTEAGLPADLVSLAVDLRRAYAAISRTSRYLETDDGTRLQHSVKSEVMSLRARLVAGQLDLDGANFHSLCLERMDALNAARGPTAPDQSAFLKGCMYDITDRCMLRFVRP